MGEAASKKYLPLANAERIATRVASELEPFCSRVAIAGSIRRRREPVGDIDLVAETSDPESLARRLYARTKVISRGDQNISVVMQNGFGIQLFIARPAQQMLIGAAEPGNWGTDHPALPDRQPRAQRVDRQAGTGEGPSLEPLSLVS